MNHLASRTQAVATVIRTFQAGSGITKEWNPASFEKSVRAPIAAFLASAPPEQKRIVIVSCADKTSSLAEAVGDDGKTPTVRAVEAAFPDEVKYRTITTVLDPDWGQNAGSASALNVGWRSLEDDINLVLSWNPDFHLSGHVLACGLDHMQRYDLPICGFYRKRWHERSQWNFFQNTATIYRLALLREHGGFSRRCDGNEGETIDVGGTKVRLAGMDDLYLYLTVCRNLGRAPLWGMYGIMAPSDWEVDFPDDPTKQAMFDEKVARQLLVMRAWAKEIFPDVPFGQLMDTIYAAQRQG